MNSDGYVLRTATSDDFDDVYRLLDGAFHEDLDEETRAAERLVFEPERTVLAMDGTALAGVSAAYTRDLTVPGAVLPAAHVTMVGVEATHRRRGILTRMMSLLLTDAAERAEPVAVLWASEGRIYQRYGYGLAAQRVTFEVEREVQLRDTPSDHLRRLRAAIPAQVTGELAKVYERVRAERVGWSSRDSRWWDYVLADHAARRDGATSLRAVLHDPGDGVDGYALWRVKNEWVPGGGSASVVVREAVAATPDAYRSLWHFLLTMDLTRQVRYSFAAVDEPLQFAVDEPRRMRSRLTDGLWARLVDVPGALASRRYLAPVDVTIEVSDPILPANTGVWHLSGGPGSAICVPADRPADLNCEIAALGAAYLGGTSLATLAATGQVRELNPGTLASASTAFGWHRAPSGIEVF